VVKPLLKSMTGYGRGTAEHNGLQVTIEIRTVNHRFAEVNVRAPKEWMRLEDSIRKYVLSRIERGRADVIVTVSQSTVSNPVVTINEALAVQGYHALLRLAAALQLRPESLFDHVLQLPGVLNVEDGGIDDQLLQQVVLDALKAACDSVLEMRSHEGEAILRDLRQRLQDLADLVHQIEVLAPEVIQSYRERLLQRIHETVGVDIVDEQRLLAEIVIYTDRTDIQEELVRLHSHIQQFETFLGATEPIGRKLDFLIQEMNREVNTIGSKANHAKIAACIVECKSKLEQMREQIQNIE
jgi:uncharacterized protein (TIGR00255 family)